LSQIIHGSRKSPAGENHRIMGIYGARGDVQLVINVLCVRQTSPRAAGIFPKPKNLQSADPVISITIAVTPLVAGKVYWVGHAFASESVPCSFPT
jgi:hypothetical protein